MSNLSKYRKKDFKQISWEEYGKILEVLYKKVNKYLKDNDLKVDAVVPILRGGAFPGTYLAYQLHSLKILPVQYKYFFAGKKYELRKLTDYPKTEFNLSKDPVFLLVESNHCFGNTAQTAVNDLKEAFPGCKIIYAADHIDYSYQKIKGVETILYGIITNETRGMNKEEIKKFKQGNISYLLPWEGIDEEWTTVQGKQFKFDTEAVGEKKLEIDLE